MAILGFVLFVLLIASALGWVPWWLPIGLAALCSGGFMVYIHLTEARK